MALKHRRDVPCPALPGCCLIGMPAEESVGSLALGAELQLKAIPQRPLSV